MFSVGLLYSVKDFLSLCAGASMTPDQFKLYFSTYKYSTAEKIIAVVFKGNWAKLSNEGQIELTERGKLISELPYKEALLVQLEDLIRNDNPSWGALLAKGRTEARNFLPADACQCFKECGLFDALTDEIIQFWDTLALAYRNYTHKRMTEIGRAGEKLSFQHEFERTGLKPLWQAVESNAAGFDLLSVVGDGNPQKLKIEVKATSGNISYAKIHITEHEWATALASLHYIFHLWHITESPTLYKVPIDVMTEHMPLNQGQGSWESVEIPFSIFSLGPNPA